MCLLTAAEVLLLKKITTKLRVYSYVGNSEIIIGKKILRPLNPNLAYMANNFFELYQLFLRLQKIILSYKSIDTSINAAIVSDFKWMDTRNAYYRGKYKKCLRRFRFARILKKFPKQLWSLEFMCLYRLGKKVKALAYLKKCLRDESLKLISIRHYFDELYMREDIKNTLIKNRSKNEYTEMVECLESEKAIIDYMMIQAEKIKHYYSKKSVNI